jgi:hypothetical protein
MANAFPMSSSLGKSHEPASMTIGKRCGLRRRSRIGKIVCSRWFPALTLDPNPMTKIRFNYCTVTISDGFVLAPSPTLTAILNTLAVMLPGYGSLPFELDADYNIARGLIEKIGVGKVVRWDTMPPSPD